MEPSEIEEEVVRLVPAFRGASFLTLGEGMDNRAILVGGEIVFRFPKHPEATERLARELALLPKLGPRLPLAVPQFEYVGRTAIGGKLFAGHRVIAGAPLPSDLAWPSMQRAAHDIARLLTELAAVPVDEARAWGVVDDDPRPGYAEDLERARTEIYPRVEPWVRDYVERLFGKYFDDKALLDCEPALLHADLAPDHIRYSASEQRITGIIDWGDASIGDPDYELSYLYPAMGARFIEEVIRHGPRRDLDKLHRKLEFFMRHDTIDTILLGLERGDPRLTESGMAALRNDAASSKHGLST
jgi:aminoglycoside 2''-phosphotransferase